MGKDYYKILGVQKNASQDEVKKAYRKLAHEHHPDKKGGDEKKFKELNEAYSVLGDEKKRMHYDRFGSAPHGGAGGSPFEGFGFGGNESDFSRVFEGAFDLGDIFNQFFGAGAARERGGSAGWRSGGRTYARNWSTVELEIPLSIAVLGGEVEVQTNLGRIKLVIPAGAQAGEAIRYNGKNNDVVFILKIKTPRHISKKAKELFEELRKEGV